jgi:2-polyprenyl-3-methyl-5-hydroxy-6-metoxy-1,4-benzoquinol methylase
MNVARRIRDGVMWVKSRMARRYYFEDFHRVYPDGVRFDRRGRLRPAVSSDIPNYLNHVKFYRFAAQFVGGKEAADVGCGSGYGCEILSRSGAARVCGADISEKAIEFARSRYGHCAEFTVQGITNLAAYPDEAFDVTICSEVLEHIKEYGMERRAMQELRRITKVGGLLAMVTPNSELMPAHGFSFEEIRKLCADHFDRFCIFENALVPFGDRRHLWERRRASGRTGVIVTESIIVSETVLPEGAIPEFKRGLTPGRLSLAHYEIDTSLLHNTHSWVVVAVKDSPDHANH